MQTEKVRQEGVGDIEQGLPFHIGCPVETLLGKGLMRTAVSLSLAWSLESGMVPHTMAVAWKVWVGTGY